jgi:ABC-type antimicrobial peptide transport system permease subunit
MFNRFRLKIRAFFRKREIEEDLDEEILYHLNKDIERHIGRGMTPEEARLAALRGFGGLQQIKELSRDARGLRVIDDLWRDLKYSFRIMSRTRGLALTIVIILALGIGANTAIFSLVDFFLIRALPVKDPGKLVLIDRALADGNTEADFAYTAFERLRDKNESLTGVFALDNTRISVTVDGQPDLIWGDFVSGNYFEVLGTSVAIGRTFNAADDDPGRPPVAVISAAYWERRFGRSSGIVGKTIDVGEIPCTIIGVTAPRFAGLNPGTSSAAIDLPMFLQPRLALRDHDTFKVVGRLKPGVLQAQAEADLDAIYQQELTERTILAPSNSSNASPVSGRPQEKIVLRSGLRGLFDSESRLASELRMLLAVVAIVFLIASVNVASLLLARASGRRLEIAVRLAIGAGRARLMRQLLTESLLLAIMGGMLGLLLAYWGVAALLSVLADGRNPISFSLTPDPRVLAFTGIASIFAAVLFGLAPAMAATRIELTPALKDESSQAGAGRQCLARSLVVSQIALSVTLLIAAGLMIRSLMRLRQVEPGFEREKVVALGVYPALIGYSYSREIGLYREVMNKLAVIPGVRSATFTRLSLDNRAGPVGPRFFETMGISVLRGRDFTEADMQAGPKVAIVSHSLARKLFSDEDPLGKRLPAENLDYDELKTDGEILVIGVVSDVRHTLRNEASDRDVYIPYTQAPPRMLGQGQFLARTATNPAAVIPAIRQSIQSVERDLPLDNVETISEQMYDSLGQERSMATLLAFFAALALILASTGLYATISHSVANRTKEVGIRMALGAQRPGILWMVLWETFKLFGVGIGIGVIVALGAARLISALLFGVSSADPASIVGGLLVMLATAAAAGYLPARRASRIDPILALRHE